MPPALPVIGEIMPPTAPQTRADPRDRQWLHRLAILLVVATFALVAIGGNVTSLGAGLAVPDGWYTFGYWTPIAPLKEWAYEVGTFWEHSHRLQGYVVGNLTILLAAWLWWRERRLARRRSGDLARPWLGWLGLVLLALVVLQGAMGAWRVDERSAVLALLHGVNGQLVLGLTVLIAVASSRSWLMAGRGGGRRLATGFRVAGWGLIGLLVLQLFLGAAVRHTGATLAIPDFPTSYGQVLPPMSAEGLQRQWDRQPAAVSWRERRATPDQDSTGDEPASEAASAESPYTVGQVHVHFAHRVGALLVTGWVLGLGAALAWAAPGPGLLRVPRTFLVTLVAVQVGLGALVIWQGAYPATATAHQATGALLLAVAIWLALRLHLVRVEAATTASQGEVSGSGEPAETGAFSRERLA
jgi:cytochrome c oxidase assembly protein subunit 15